MSVQLSTAFLSFLSLYQLSQSMPLCLSTCFQSSPASPAETSVTPIAASSLQLGVETLDVSIRQPNDRNVNSRWRRGTVHWQLPLNEPRPDVVRVLGRKHALNLSLN